MFTKGLADSIVIRYTMVVCKANIGGLMLHKHLNEGYAAQEALRPGLS